MDILMKDTTRYEAAEPLGFVGPLFIFAYVDEDGDVAQAAVVTSDIDVLFFDDDAIQLRSVYRDGWRVEK